MAQLVLLPWSFSELGWVPPSSWRAMLDVEVGERITELGPHELCTLLHG
jgi:hypothetical protein